MAQPFSWDNTLDNLDGIDKMKSEPELRVMNPDETDESAENLRSADGLHVDEILLEAVAMQASDIHLHTGMGPVFRVDGSLVRTNYQPLEPQIIQRLLYDILTGEQVEILEREYELDLSYDMGRHARFRVNVFRQKGSLQAAFRVVPSEIPTLEDLQLPLALKKLTTKNSGLILVTGPTGSGKSTTIAAMIDHINQSRPLHILTLEDPIEYLHKDKSAMVSQREMHTDTVSFHNALRAVLREDPDVILVGEMRDLETISATLTLAETGHLVFATLHTRSAAQTVDRIVDVFPPHQQEQIKVQLSNTIEAIISQVLLPKVEGGRIVATEVLVATSAIRNLIREGKTHQIGFALETGYDLGMHPMDRDLASLCVQGVVSMENARIRSNDPENFDRYLRGE